MPHQLKAESLSPSSEPELLGVFARNVARARVADTFSVMADLRLPLAQFNFSLLGLPSIPEHLGAEDCGRVADAATRAAVSIWGVSATFNAVHPDVELRRHDILLAQRMIGMAPLLGSPVLSLCTGSRDPFDKWAPHRDNVTAEAWADLLSTLGQLLPGAEAAGITLGVEPEAANVVSNAGKAVQLIEELGSRRIVVILDVANLMDPARPTQQAQIIDEAVEELAGHLVCVHAKDLDAGGATVAPGEGVVDFGRLARRLEGAGLRPAVIIQDCPEPKLPGARQHLIDVGLAWGATG